jgi:hypothetical protein
MEDNVKNIRHLYFVELIDSVVLQPGYPTILLSKNQKKIKATFLKSIRQVVEKIELNSYKLIFSRYIHPLFVLPFNKHNKVVCDIDDVYFEVQKSKIKNAHSFYKKSQLLILFFFGKRQIKSTIKKITHPIIVKESDRKYYGLDKAFCLPNLPFNCFLDGKQSKLAVPDLDSETIRNLGFIGKLSYPPNYKGLIDFLTFVWKPLISKGLKINLFIAGSGTPPKELEALITSTSQVNYLGFVEHAIDFWDKIHALIVPVNEGGGSNIKIAEAFMHGKIVVANSFSSRGYENFLNEKYLLVPTNHQEWKNLLNKNIFNNPATIKSLIQKSKDEFDIQKWNNQLVKFLAQLLCIIILTNFR